MTIKARKHPECSSGMHTLAITNNSLIKSKSHSASRNHFWYWKPSQLPRTSEVMYLGGQPAMLTLLNLIISNYILKMFFLYPQVSSASLATEKEDYRGKKNQLQGCGAQSQIVDLQYNS